MKNFGFKWIALPVAVLAALAIVVPNAQALHSPEHYTMFDNATYISPGNASNRAVRIVSDVNDIINVADGGIDYTVEAGITFANIQQLSTDYRFDADDSCGQGSPRFQLNMQGPNPQDRGNIIVYIGPPPNYTLCPPGVWTNTGDLLEGVNLIDTFQLSNGSHYDPYASALAKYGSFTVTGIQLIVDAGYAALDGEQAIDVDNTLIRTTMFTYEVPIPTNKHECKNGGWMTLADGSGNAFKNQGDCVSFFVSKGKN